MATWLNLAAIAIGGGLGSVSRYLITVAAAAVPGGSTMVGTTLANVIGCAALGALGEFSVLEDTISERAQLAMRVGYLGGLTTFSTFAAESTAMAVNARLGGAMIYVAANILVGWAVLLGSAALVRGWMT